MTWLSPFFLIGLIPWAAWAAWLLWGRRKKQGVPFLELWQGPIVGKPKRWAFQFPSAALLSIILAVLVAILAAAGPMVPRSRGGPARIGAVIDRGITMSLPAPNGKRRFLEGEELLATLHSRDFPGAQIDSVNVPDGPLLPTAIDDPAALVAAIRAELGRVDGPVFVVSDRELAIDDPRLVQLCPTSKIDNAGIALLAVRADPKPAAMVRIRNLSPQKSATLFLRSGGQEISRRIDLPDSSGAGAGADRDYFFDLPAAGDVIEARIESGDPSALNHAAFAVRLNAWPKVEAAAALPAEVQRMIEVFGRRRPPGDGSKTIGVATSNDALPADEPGAIVVGAGESLHPLDSSLPPKLDGAMLKIDSIDWPAALKDASAASPPAGDWMAIVSVGNQPVVMVRTQPVKRVWVGFDPPGFARTADFVVFWNAIFDFLNSGLDDGKAQFVSQAVERLPGDWKLAADGMINDKPVENDGLIPGIYRRSDGVLCAMNSPAVPTDLASPSDWEAKSRSLARNETQKNPALREWLILFAILLVSIASATWARTKRVEPP